MVRRLSASVLSAAVVGGAAIAGTGVAQAAPTWTPIESREVKVPESSAGVPVYMTFERGDEARIRCTGKVWGGVWLTGENGPDGWADAAPWTFPMSGWYGGRSFAAIARFKDTTSTYTTAWRHAGTSSYHAVPFQSRMELRVNDDRPGNGDHAFTCTVEKWRLVA